MCNKYICVNCGYPVSELYRRYGPSVLKLTNCERCKLVSDKYVEYDPVILMVDIVLLSKEAYRHVLHNTKFKEFWKLVIALLVMDTYNLWSSEYITKSNDCFQNRPYDIEAFIQSFWNLINLEWKQGVKFLYNHMDQVNCSINSSNTGLSNDFFIANEEFYKTFIRILLGSVVFAVVASSLMTLASGCISSLKKVDLTMLCKAITLGNLGIFFTLPTVIWGKNPDYSIHSTLVLGYTLFGLVNVVSVSYNSKKYLSAVVVLLAYILKCITLKYSKDVINHMPNVANMLS